MKDNKKTTQIRKREEKDLKHPLCKGGSGAVGGRLSGRESFGLWGEGNNVHISA